MLNCENGKITREEGVVAHDGAFFVEYDDPQIAFEFDKPAKYISLDVRFPEGYAGDGITLYYAAGNESFSQERIWKAAVRDRAFITNVVELPYGAKRLRLDVAELLESTGADGNTGITHIAVGGFSHAEEAFCHLLGVARDDDRPRILVATHDLTLTGAPLLAHGISDKFRRAGAFVAAIACSQRGLAMSQRYWESGTPLLELDAFDQAARTLTSNDRSVMTCRMLRCAGFKHAYLNSVASGCAAPALKTAGCGITSLVHETEQSIRIHDMRPSACDIADAAERLIFPTEQVRDGFLNIVGETEARLHVQPQGIYLSDPADTEGAKALLEDLGVESNTRVVLGSGTANLRKGIDLFISAAIELKRRMAAGKVAFIWAGDFESSAESDMFRKRLEAQVAGSPIADCFHRLPFMESSVYKGLLARADVFWCTSRDDPYPSVVLEAMLNQVPVVAFAGAGGTDVMLDDGRGAFAHGFSVGDLADKTRDALGRSWGTAHAAKDAQEWVAKNHDFGKYARWLLALSQNDGVPEAFDPSETEEEAERGDVSDAAGTQESEVEA